MSDNHKRSVIKRIDMALFILLMLAVLYCIERSDSVAFMPIMAMVICLSIYFITKAVIGIRHSNPANEDDEEITQINFMHRSKAVGALIAAVVKAENITSPEDFEKYSAKVESCNERINSLWKTYLENDDIDMEKACNWLFTNLDNRECYVSVEYMFDLAHYVKPITDEAWKCLYDMMKRLHISEEDIKYLRHKYVAFYKQEESDSNPRECALRLLGVNSDASVDDIHEAFSKMINRYNSEGITDVNLVKYTKVKMQEVNSAHVFLTDQVADGK